MKKICRLICICAILVLSACDTGADYHIDIDGNIHKTGESFAEYTDRIMEDKKATPTVREEKEKQTELSAEEIYEKSIDSVVEIRAEGPVETSTGTGFFYDDKGTVVTNYHVIDGCQSAVIIISSGESYKIISVLGYDKGRDIAILSTECSNSKPLYRRTSVVKTGEKMYALGSSLGLTGTLSDGIISAVGRVVGEYSYLQTTAPISSGNSGGPLLDTYGNVIGITCASFDAGQNLNLAIPIEDVYTISKNKNIALDKLFRREIHWISDYRFLYYEDDAAYVLLFQLADKNEVPMSASGTVKICIVNNTDEIVYSKTCDFSPADFEEWIYDDTEEMYLATIYISPKDIIRGNSKQGKVFFEVSGEDFSFEQCSISVNNLPAIDKKPTATPKPTKPPKSTATPQPVCDYYGCSNIVEKDQSYCAKHKCKNPKCLNDIGYNQDYCDACKCYEVTCGNPRAEDSLRCEQHTCMVEDCTSRRQGKYYCYGHECNYCDSLRVEGSLQCKEHTCLMEGCSFYTNSGYCSIHKCFESNCENGQQEGGYYCIDHTCVIEGCFYDKYRGDYCAIHAQ